MCPFLTKDDSAHKLHMLEKHEAEAGELGNKGKGSPKYECVAPECDKSFRLLTSLKSHIYRMGRNHNPAEKKYSCDDCGSLFKSIVAKRKHHRSEHQKVVTLISGWSDILVGLMVDNTFGCSTLSKVMLGLL